MCGLLLLTGLVLALPPTADEGFQYPPQKRGEVTAYLTVHVPEGDGVAPRVRLMLRVEGPNGMQVEKPRLEGATEAWQSQYGEVTRAVNGLEIWEQSVELKQVKPGSEPLPAVRLRVKPSETANWEEAQWTDLLKEPLGLPKYERQPDPPPSPSWLPWLIGGIAGLALGLLVAWLWQRRGRETVAPLPPDQWALGEIRRLEATALNEPEMFHTQLSNVVRRFIAERFQLPAQQQTTAEFLDSLPKIPGLPYDQQTRVRDLFERCDLVKFARSRVSADECRRAATLARDFIGHVPAADVPPDLPRRARS